MTTFLAKSVLIPAALVFSYTTVVRVYNDDFGRFQKENFRNNSVRVVKGWTYTYSGNGTPVSNGIKTSEERFDPNGNRVGETWYDEKGAETMSSTYSYDESGIELRNVGMQMHKPFYNNWMYAYNDTTKELTKYHSQNLINKEKWIYTFDGNGNKQEERHFDGTGMIDSRFAFKYDEKGRLSEKIEFDAYDNLYARTEYLYDEKGNNVSENLYNSDSELKRQYAMKYDQKGNLTTRFEMDAKGVTQKMTIFLYEFYSTPQDK
jgi:hypothetical protein